MLLISVYECAARWVRNVLPSGGEQRPGASAVSAFTRCTAAWTALDGHLRARRHSCVLTVTLKRPHLHCSHVHSTVPSRQLLTFPLFQGPKQLRSNPSSPRHPYWSSRALRRRKGDPALCKSTTPVHGCNAWPVCKRTFLLPQALGILKSRSSCDGDWMKSDVFGLRARRSILARPPSTLLTHAPAHLR